VTLLYSLTLFVNAALMFIIEPMVAKMILPLLGGSPAVWIACLLFFQGYMLIGYAYAHYGSSLLGIKRHAWLHLGLVFAAALTLPVALPMQWFSGPTETPTPLVLETLTVSIGFPFFVITAGAPLLQKWFAQCRHSAARDPYFLYAASNSGSLVGLLAYPILVEPNFTLTQQSRYWFCGYVGLSALILLCLLAFLSGSSRPSAGTFTDVVASNEPHHDVDRGKIPITVMRRLRWVFWSLVPSSLLCGVTTYITTDVVSAPLFWVIPLAAYLISFIVAFTGSTWTTGAFMVRSQAFLLLGAALTVAMGATSPVYIVLPLHLLAFLTTAVVCHGRLAEDRPAVIFLTDFYLWISVGGVLGGLANAVIAPQIFAGVYEYPLMMVAAAFARPFVGGRTAVSQKLDWILPLLLCVAMAGLVELSKIVPALAHANLQLMIFGVTGTICLLFAYRPVRFGMGFIALLLIAGVFPKPLGQELFRGRSFFGAYRVTYDAGNMRHLLFHGTTIHGAQNVEPSKQLNPLSYYHRTSPVGQVLVAGARSGSAREVAVVGLGAGALACHGAPAQHFTFFEIDPLVERIARDERLFTYLRDCPPKIDVIIGDARLTLANAPDRHFDIFILDAFSSDVIPVHLLTRKAIELYLRKTANDGLLLFHISNRYMDLAPVLDRLAKELNLVAWIQNDVNVTAKLSAEGKNASRWVLLARDQGSIERFAKEPPWSRLDGDLGGDPWTDEFSNVLKVLVWR
jgi:SAM-dependent methyltransferase